METKHIGFVDRVWGSICRHDLNGDMYFHFQEMTDTITEDIEGLIKNSEDYCFTERAVAGDDVMDEYGSFAVYEIYEADVELEDEDDIIELATCKNKVIKEVHVCATKEQADWIEDLSSYKGVKVFKYREK